MTSNMAISGHIGRKCCNLVVIQIFAQIVYFKDRLCTLKNIDE